MSSQLHIIPEIELGANPPFKEVVSLVLQQKHEWHHYFEIRAKIDVTEGAGKWNISKSRDFIGQDIKIAFTDARNGEQVNFFKGVVTGVNLARYSGAAADVVIKGYSPTILLDDGPHCYAHVNKTLREIIQESLKNYPDNQLKPSISPSLNPMMPYCVQYNESVYNFIGRLANRFGQWYYYNGTNLVFGKLEENGSEKLVFGHDLDSFEAGVKVLPLKFEASTYNYLNNEIYKSASKMNVAGLDNWGKSALDKSDSLYAVNQTLSIVDNIASSSDLESLVNTRKSALAGDLVTFTGVSGNPKLKVGTKVKIEGARSASFKEDAADYGSFIIISVDHFTNGTGMYQNKFEAIPSSLSVPQFNEHIRDVNCETQAAVVVDNVDPDGLGRVKVRFYWQPDGGTSDWVRMSTPHAGPNRGVYFVPEIEDEVLVGFEGNNPNCPYVVGGYFHGKSNSSDRKDKDNLIKTIRTISGNEIQFSDKEGEEHIHIFTADKLNEVLITMKDDGLIQITSNKNIKITAAENIEVFAKNMSFNAEKLVEFKSEEFKVGTTKLIQHESNQDMKSKATKIKAEATDSLQMSANAKGEFKSNGTIEISAQAKTSVKASGQLEMTASGQASLKAGIVMIN